MLVFLILSMWEDNEFFFVIVKSSVSLVYRSGDAIIYKGCDFA